MALDHHFVHDTNASDEVALLMYGEIASAIERGLSRLGIAAVFEGSTGIFALRVVDTQHVGTAYLELRDGGMRMRIVLLEEVTDEQFASSASSADASTPAA
jgi:hypothetical protein